MTTPLFTFDSESFGELASQERRAPELAAAAAMSLPSAETEQWRYSPIGELESGRFAPVLAPGVLVEPTVDLGSGHAATIRLIDGFLQSAEVAEGWAAKGLSVTVDNGRVLDLSIVEDDAAETVFDAYHRALSPGAVVITVPDGVAVTEPVLVLSHHGTAAGVSFPHVVVEAGEASELRVVELQTSVQAEALSVPVIELRVGQAANVSYSIVQNHAREHWQIGRQLTTIAGQATGAINTGAFGGRYARVRVDTRLAGRGATGNMSAAYYGDGDQLHDFRIFQHHDARDTRSDLLFKGTQDERSGSVYTGLIHIHEDGAGSNAFQTNRNVKLSDEAWAWSVPNLEIENNEVHCSHASTVSPVDGDQQFYLQARGVPPTVADRLIVAGFFREVLDRLPVSVRPAIRSLIDEKLETRSEASRV